MTLRLMAVMTFRRHRPGAPLPATVPANCARMIPRMRADELPLDGTPEALARAIAEQGSDIVAAGGAQRLIEAAERVPPELRTPELELAVAEAHAVRGHPDAALACLRRAGDDATRLRPAVAWRTIAAHILR
ncbi:MAG: hypothetical protein ACRDGT_12830, partial [Candidatus Limnocylindria bacterium]